MRGRRYVRPGGCDTRRDSRKSLRGARSPRRPSRRAPVRFLLRCSSLPTEPAESSGGHQAERVLSRGRSCARRAAGRRLPRHPLLRCALALPAARNIRAARGGAEWGAGPRGAGLSGAGPCGAGPVGGPCGGGACRRGGATRGGAPLSSAGPCGSTRRPRAEAPALTHTPPESAPHAGLGSRSGNTSPDVGTGRQAPRPSPGVRCRA